MCLCIGATRWSRAHSDGSGSRSRSPRYCVCACTRACRCVSRQHDNCASVRVRHAGDVSSDSVCCGPNTDRAWSAGPTCPSDRRHQHDSFVLHTSHGCHSHRILSWLNRRLLTFQRTHCNSTTQVYELQKTHIDLLILGYWMSNIW